MTTGIYLAHLNPVTNAHVEIINDLLKEKDQIVVMPVRFLKQDQEINSKSFPFNYDIRKPILDEVNFNVRKGAKITVMGQNGA